MKDNAKSSGIEVVGPLEVDPPPNTVSRYMQTTDPSTLNHFGCQAGTSAKATSTFGGISNNLVVLDFGQPYFDPSTSAYGAYDYAQNYDITTQISVGVKNFLMGFWACTQGALNNPFLVLAIGTNNAYGQLPLPAGSPESTTNWSNHGTAWGNMVNNVESYVINQGYTSRETVVGADDIESGPGFGPYSLAKAWVDAYGKTPNGGYSYYDYGSADGCPPYGNCVSDPRCNSAPIPPDAGCDWTQDAVWYVAAGAASAFPVPEIYTRGNTDPPFGTQANTWQHLSAYACANHGGPIDFFGVLTELADYANVKHISQKAASQLVNTPSDGYNQLYRDLQTNPCTDQSGPRRPLYLSDITNVGQ